MNCFSAVTAAFLTTACAHLAVHAAQPGGHGSKPSNHPSVHAAKAHDPADTPVAKKSTVKSAHLTGGKGAGALLPADANGAPQVSDNQLEIASRVLTGVADCEFNQTVRVEPHQGRPGHFRVAFKNVAYSMVPEETTTGAVRLYDAKAEVVWLQIPTKSMLMNAKAGQRVVDACMHTEQRIAASAPASVLAANALGWSTPIPPVPQVSPVVVMPVISSSLALSAAQASLDSPPVSTLALSEGTAAAVTPTSETLPGSGPAPQDAPAADSSVTATRVISGPVRPYQK